MPFLFRKTEIEGVMIVEPKIFGDERGYFYETYKRSEFSKNGISADLDQDNQSFSKKGVLRGLHFQREPYAQGKLVRAITGKIFDVAVDIREDSKTFGRYVSAILSGENKIMLWIPEGFAHGFLALEDSIVHYKATHEYNKTSEGGIIWNDPDINIEWPMDPETISEKDMAWPTLREFRANKYIK
ncbi:dTDP-4-dehydrorhamnose 3,5-epimerase [Picrophilus oshimae]|uniref:dTDP-4-dehydrorhamnose 3,5-epimerase n=1 Tax=Picrophilus torridus (strain ATCC 700027 / DSM 9790 / JCM 10055 / NBRC 100828 / KAW 2/3) TaxID=1122961 RepID=A0A8G2L7A7_PICTO|nr:dTDP-4-dehydrorhamnose 3,5-epimerase [Picrophilus oshimae]SMD30775.1 dTDP-4-dehydrorhamnose 3,5-epimerase [Picrophilus oshimae DSM 9789]